MKKIVQMGSFVARADDGTSHEVHIMGKTYQTTAMHGQVVEWSSPSPDHLVTSDGHQVNWIARGQYELLGRGAPVQIKSDDPTAP